MSGPCLSSGFETFRVDSYAVSIRSLKSYSDSIYVDLKIMFLSVNKNSIQRKLEGILLVQVCVNPPPHTRKYEIYMTVIEIV